PAPLPSLPTRRSSDLPGRYGPRCGRRRQGPGRCAHRAGGAGHAGLHIDRAVRVVDRRGPARISGHVAEVHGRLQRPCARMAGGGPHRHFGAVRCAATRHPDPAHRGFADRRTLLAGAGRRSGGRGRGPRARGTAEPHSHDPAQPAARYTCAGRRVARQYRAGAQRGTGNRRHAFHAAPGGKRPGLRRPVVCMRGFADRATTHAYLAHRAAHHHPVAGDRHLDTAAFDPRSARAGHHPAAPDAGSRRARTLDPRSRRVFLKHGADTAGAEAGRTLLPPRARMGTPPHVSSTLATCVKSASSPQSAVVSSSISRTADPTTMGTPMASDSSTHRRTSLYARRAANPMSKVPVSTAFGNLSCVAVLRPDPALMTSSITAGSRPAFTPMAIASDVMATAAADSRLFASFIVWPMPGSAPR